MHGHTIPSTINIILTPLDIIYNATSQQIMFFYLGTLSILVTSLTDKNFLKRLDKWNTSVYTNQEISISFGRLAQLARASA